MAEDLKCGDTIIHTIVLDDTRNEGLTQMPVYAHPSAPLPCKIIRLHQPIETFVVRWTATRHGGPPKVPHPTSIDPNNVFLRGGRNRDTAPPDAAGVAHEWTISGWYEYAKIVPRGLASPLLGVKLPWDTEPANTYTIPAEKYVSDLIAKPDELDNLLNPIKSGGPGG